MYRFSIFQVQNSCAAANESTLETDNWDELVASSDDQATKALWFECYFPMVTTLLVSNSSFVLSLINFAENSISRV
jgi:hypothetical protein